MFYIRKHSQCWPRLDQCRLKCQSRSRFYLVRTFSLCNNRSTLTLSLTHTHTNTHTTGVELGLAINILGAVLHGQLVDRKLWMYCKCWTKAGTEAHQIINYSAPPDKDNHMASAGLAKEIACFILSFGPFWLNLALSIHIITTIMCLIPATNCTVCSYIFCIVVCSVACNNTVSVMPFLCKPLLLYFTFKDETQRESWQWLSNRGFAPLNFTVFTKKTDIQT